MTPEQETQGPQLTHLPIVLSMLNMAMQHIKQFDQHNILAGALIDWVGV